MAVLGRTPTVPGCPSRKSTAFNPSGAARRDRLPGKPQARSSRNQRLQQDNCILPFILSRKGYQHVITSWPKKDTRTTRSAPEQGSDASFSSPFSQLSAESLLNIVQIGKTLVPLSIFDHRHVRLLRHDQNDAAQSGWPIFNILSSQTSVSMYINPSRPLWTCRTLTMK